MWRLNNILLNNTWIEEGISREIFKYFKLYENKTNLSKFVEWNENSSLREIYSIECIC